MYRTVSWVCTQMVRLYADYVEKLEHLEKKNLQTF